MENISEFLNKFFSFFQKNVIVFLLFIVAIPFLFLGAYYFGSTIKKPQKAEVSKITVNLKSQSEVIDETIAIIRQGDYDTFVTKVREEVKNVNLPGSKGVTLLMAAVDMKDMDMVQFLFSRADLGKSTAEPNKANPYTGDTALMIALKNNDEYMSELLMIAGANLNAVNNYGQTPLLFASEAKNRTLVEYLIARGAVAGASTENLFYFVTKKNPVGVEAMLKSAINPNVRNKSGFTPLYMAASLGENIILRMLLAYKADVNAVVGDGSTALIGAARYKKPAALKMLLEAGADVNIKNNKGETALYWASYNNMVESVDQLLLLKADPTIKTNEGLTPFGIAQKRKFNDLISLFKKNKINK
ncbi:Ankyrin [Elusimicrobium minutum Pei191]|uniref:Ankyrin n=1 Tax=Elusimicrobium minutum (strain Pei191) TaxID=445932 RepID=B2KC90_ELUMP|nr:ankyrin repeat domain-containing protein [Elusimicrobium minutum]ACC98217.1 Ankyrin [Elusimicrobium minutum Pei191]